MVSLLRSFACVCQVGLTDRESYIHRLGRTARAGESGQGVLLLAPFEQPMLNQVPVWRCMQQLCMLHMQLILSIVCYPPKRTLFISCDVSDVVCAADS